MQERLPPRHEDGSFQIGCPVCREPVPQAFYAGASASAGSDAAEPPGQSAEGIDSDLARTLDAVRHRHAELQAKQGSVGGLVSAPDFSLQALRPATCEVAVARGDAQVCERSDVGSGQSCAEAKAPKTTDTGKGGGGTPVGTACGEERADVRTRSGAATGGRGRQRGHDRRARAGRTSKTSPLPVEDSARFCVGGGSVAADDPARSSVAGRGGQAAKPAGGAATGACHRQRSAGRRRGGRGRGSTARVQE